MAPRLIRVKSMKFPFIIIFKDAFCIARPIGAVSDWKGRRRIGWSNDRRTKILEWLEDEGFWNNGLFMPCHPFASKDARRCATKAKNGSNDDNGADDGYSSRHGIVSDGTKRNPTPLSGTKRSCVSYTHDPMTIMAAKRVGNDKDPPTAVRSEI